MSSLLSALINQAATYVTTGVVPRAMGNRHPSIAPYETVSAADRLLVVAVGNDGQFAALASAVGPVSYTHLDVYKRQVHWRNPVPAGWLYARLETRQLAGGYVDEDGELWTEDGVLVAQSRQLARYVGTGDGFS